MEDSGEFGRVWGKINILRVKVLASKPPKHSHRTSKARRFCEVLQVLIEWSQRTEDQQKIANVQAFVMMSR